MCLFCKRCRYVKYQTLLWCIRASLSQEVRLDWNRTLLFWRIFSTALRDVHVPRALRALGLKIFDSAGIWHGEISTYSWNILLIWALPSPAHRWISVVLIDVDNKGKQKHANVICACVMISGFISSYIIRSSRIYQGLPNKLVFSSNDKK